MPNSLNEDQDHRKDTSMEDATGMTIEYLRARLLSERYVSRVARQRADELSKRVLELEEQLKTVTLQRMRAEKATAVVLTILENHGATDVSEAYNSSSDQEATPCGSEVDHNPLKEQEALADGKLRRKDVDAFSGYELESSSLSGRSFSWKSGKDSPHSGEKKFKDSSRRRRSSFVSSASSSPKHVGKSCRQTRRRETRSAVEEPQSDTSRHPLQGDEVAACSGVPTCSNFGPETLKEGSENHEEEYLLEGPVSEVLENRRVTNGHYFSGHGGDKDMERALEHQAELVGRYEAEEKAQREWEEKFRENNSRTSDSCDLGNHSDVTEERDESRAPAPPSHAETFAPHNQDAKSKEVGGCFSKESITPKGFQPPPQFDMQCLQDPKSSSMIAYKPAASEFAFSMAKGSHDQEHSDTHHYPPVNLSHGTPGNHAPQVSSSNGSSLCEEASEGNNEYALMPHEPSEKLVSVLKALQQAKSSLEQNLNRSPVVEDGSVGKAIEPSVPVLRAGDRFKIPVASAGLFRLPTDFQFEATTKGNFLSSGSQLSLTNYSTGPAGDRFFSSPYVESRSSTSSGDRFLTTHTYPYMETRSGMHTRSPAFQTTLELGLTTSSRYSSPDPRLSAGLPSASQYAYPAYPFYSGLMPRVLSDGLSRSLTSREVGLPPTAHFWFYDDHTRPNMYS